jgi:hypothetical protein
MCGRAEDQSPLPLSEVLAILAEALAVSRDPVATLDVIAVRAGGSAVRSRIWLDWGTRPRWNRSSEDRRDHAQGPCPH